MYRISPFVRYFALALTAGILVATLWVNLAPFSYYDAIEYRLFDLPLPGWMMLQQPSITPLSLVSNLLMPLYFFFIGKEMWESLVLERGVFTLSRHPALSLARWVGPPWGLWRYGWWPRPSPIRRAKAVCARAGWWASPRMW